MVNALTNFDTPITMQPYLLLWCASLLICLWFGGVCIYHWLPRNELHEKYIPGVNIVLADMGVFQGQQCCGARYYDTNTNISQWTIFVVCFPLLLDTLLLILNLSSVIYALIALQQNFGILFLIASDSYNGTYKIFFNLSSFYRTFTYTGGANTSPDGTSAHMPSCLDYDPVGSIKMAIAFAVIGLLLQFIVFRVSFVALSLVVLCCLHDVFLY